MQAKVLVSKYTARLLNYHKKYSPLPYRSGQFSSSDAIQASQASEYKVKMTTKYSREDLNNDPDSFHISVMS
jgi:hypothetical protein